MALKIISNNNNVQEDKAIDYPCLMESINTQYEVIVLALDCETGIAIKNNFFLPLLGLLKIFGPLSIILKTGSPTTNL